MKPLLFFYSFFFLLFVSGCISIKKQSTLEASFVAIVVKDMDTSLAWYSDKLGFELVNLVDMQERGFKQANLKFENTSIELIESNTSISAKDILAEKPKRTLMTGFFKFGFTLSDFDDWVEHLTKLDVEFHGTVVKDQVSGKKMVIIKDPDGNRIQFFEQ